VVRKLEEGADPDTLEEQLGGHAEEDDGPGMGLPGDPGEEPPVKEGKFRFRIRRDLPRRDEKLYDYE
jgi:hypothetical protein